MPGATREAQPQLANLHAFAKLYGVIRWFHPSDAAASIDWDRFAVDGVRRVIGAGDARALRAALTELIAPIAPTVHLAGPGEPFPDEPALHPASTAGLEVVAWEHEGYGDTSSTSVYASKRRHRDRLAPVRGLSSGSVWQAIVGSATAGTNGNIAVIAMPTGCHLRFTGMRVIKHDGTQHHLVGVQPTIPASRTIAGVAAGRDEVLERALAYVRNGVK